MSGLMQDYFWIYIVASLALFAALIFLAPRIVKFLDDFVERRQERRAKKIEADKAAAKNKNRYKTF